MARKKIVISSGGGGIAPGVPFTVGAVLAVQQVTPPFAFTARLAFVGDPEESIVAPGVLAGVHSFVVGEKAIDHVGGDRSVLVGYNLEQGNSGAGQNTDQVIIGNTILLDPLAANSQGAILIGSNIAQQVLPLHKGVGGTVAIGNGVILKAEVLGLGADAINDIVIGPSTQVVGASCVIIGAASQTTGSEGVGVGFRAIVGVQGVGLGSTVTAADHSIAIGANTRSGVNGIAIGYGANFPPAGDSCIMIGIGSGGNMGNSSIVLGRNATTPANNFCQIGGDLTYPINEVRFGAGNSQATGGVTYTFGVTDTFGANVIGNLLVIRGGSGTGSWANTIGGPQGGIEIQCGLIQAPGATQQVPTPVISCRHADLNVALWGGLGATFGGGVLCLFIKNASVVPTVAPVGGGLLYATGGALHWLGSAGTDTILAAA
jgi:hypothetical protein